MRVGRWRRASVLWLLLRRVQFALDLFQARGEALDGALPLVEAGVQRGVVAVRGTPCS
jgi:hypothetical protein